jgi:2-polyprenyl-3-methyl-5-hydroxy-6-metoxy-1,4-benzoquinol methylase
MQKYKSLTNMKNKKNYLEKNDKYWKKNSYFAPNVESFLFRFYGRILLNDLNISGRKSEKILDFGCGQAGNLNFSHKNGFDVYGVDIARKM